MYKHLYSCKHYRVQSIDFTLNKNAKDTMDCKNYKLKSIKHYKTSGPKGIKLSNILNYDMKAYKKP